MDRNQQAFIITNDKTSIERPNRLGKRRVARCTLLKTGKNCGNCLLMRAKIPLVQSKKGQRIDYNHATARCVLGLISVEDASRDKTFNVGYLFRQASKQWPARWREGEHCLEFIDMRGDDGIALVNKAMAAIVGKNGNGVGILSN